MSGGRRDAGAGSDAVRLAHHDHYSDRYLRDVLGGVRRIAMVGASTLWRRPSYYAMAYLQKRGYRVIPVNPTREGAVLRGETVHARLSDVPGPIDMVDVFRPSEEALAIAEDAVANRAEKEIKVLWMQISVRDDRAAALAEAAGLVVVMDRCPKIEYARLSGELGWCGVNSRIVTSRSLRPPGR